MATHGSVVRFDPDKEEQTAYVECLNFNLIADEVTDHAKKCGILTYVRMWTSCLQNYPQSNGFRDSQNY